MEHSRSKDGSITESLAKRLKIILEQYHNHQFGEEKYEVTLSLAVLQTLLTHFNEIIKNKNYCLINEEIKNSKYWHISDKSILLNTFPGRLTAVYILRHIRNAMSHPNATDHSEYHKTGYITKSNNFGEIKSIRFINVNKEDSSKVFMIEFKKKEIINFVYVLTQFLTEPIKNENEYNISPYKSLIPND